MNIAFDQLIEKFKKDLKEFGYEEHYVLAKSGESFLHTAHGQTENLILMLEDALFQLKMDRFNNRLTTQSERSAESN